MGAEAHLLPLAHGPEPVTQVFIHGYHAVGSKRALERLAGRIMAARPAGQVHLLYWHSGSWRMEGAALLGQAYRLYRGLRLARAFNPAWLVADAAAWAGASAWRFKHYERQAETLGRDLQRHLEWIEAPADRPLHLIGHSLGARTLVTALDEGALAGFRPVDCVLLGGAADLDADWPQRLARLEGRLYNVWSSADRVLACTPDARRRVGRHPIPLDDPRLANHELEGMGHTDYWARLAEFLPRAWPGFPRSEAEEGA
jgi:hypothetical protein